MTSARPSEKVCTCGAMDDNAHQSWCPISKELLTSNTLVQRLRSRLVTVPKPGAKPFKQTYPVSYTHTAGTVHKAGDSAGYVSFNPTMGACAAGYDPNNVMAIEHIFVVDPLLEEAAQALESLPDETCEVLRRLELLLCAPTDTSVKLAHELILAQLSRPALKACEQPPAVNLSSTEVEIAQTAATARAAKSEG